ncbi:MAG: endonuclease/exonuclease/phosphatase family protein [Chloroflexota bacterium]
MPMSRSAVFAYTVFFLFFFQLITDFVEAVYVFGLLQTSIPPEIVSVLFLLSPFLLLFLPRSIAPLLLRATGLLVLVCRVVEVMLDTRGRMLVTGLGVSAFLLWLPLVLWQRGQESDEGDTFSVGLGLILALAAAVALRALYSGLDLSTYGWFRLLNVILAMPAALFLVRQPSAIAESAPTRANPRSIPASLGLVAALALLYFAFSAPNVMARWTEASYSLVVGLLVLSLVAFTWLLVARRQWLFNLPYSAIVVWNALFVLCLGLAVRGQQVSFFTDKGAYPQPWAAIDPLYTVILFLALLLSPVVLYDAMLFMQGLAAGRPSLRRLGAGFSLAALFLLVMILSHVFTTVYDYIPVVGPFFRDKFWLVYLVVTLTMALPVVWIGGAGMRGWGDEVKKGVVTAVFCLGLVAVGGVVVRAARPEPPPEDHSLAVLTYNIQQGYSEDGRKNYAGQLALMREQDADLIGLQESDTNRIAGGNADLVRYLADELDLYSYYGPGPVPGTFGIALLSRYPLENPRTYYLYSEGEQVAAIHAQIRVSGRFFNVYVTHLGNGGPIIQQQQFLQLVTGDENVIAMGDFNFDPSTEQYRITRLLLEDAWLLRWPDGVDGNGLAPAGRIDHIFVSPGLAVTDARYIESDASDHPAVAAELEW